MQKGGEIPEILAKWETEQQKLKEKGMDAKQIANIASLTARGGPFTKPEQVDEYIKDDNESDTVKNKRRYLEVS